MVEKRMVSARIKRKIHLRDNFTCYYCGEAPTEKDIRLDHIIPYSKGGKSDIWNVVTACNKCNSSKGTKRLTNENEVLLEIRDRNIQCELDKPEVLNTPNKKLHTVRRLGKIDGLNYLYPRDYELIIHVTLQYMTDVDKKIALAVLLNGTVHYDSEGRGDSVSLIFNREYFKMVTGVDIEDVPDSGEVRFFSWKPCMQPPRYSHNIEERLKGGGWCFRSLTLMRGVQYFREDLEFKVTLCLTNTDRFIDGIIEKLIEPQTCNLSNKDIQ